MSQERKGHTIRRSLRLKALAVSAENLINKAKKWRIVSDRAADELTVAMIKVEQALERLQ